MADRRHLHLSAIEAYKEALSIKEREGSVLNNLGMAYYMNRQYRQAAKNFHQAMQTGLQSPKVANNLGLALAKLGKYPQAFDAFKMGTDPAKAYNNVGIALLEAGQPRRAISCFQKAIDLQPTFYEKANENLIQAKRAAKKIKKKSSPTITGCL
jgi:Tfp pilus assembly protein PilF